VLPEGDRDAIRVQGDAGALEQMLLNLLMNAAQAMAAGGVAQVIICRTNGRAVVRIADTGRGLAPEILTRLGEPFFSSREEGTGLGYSIARQIAVAHGGDITVVSTSAAGTTVEVSLPETVRAVPPNSR
jgi:signal transduction histidine kinase